MKKFISEKQVLDAISSVLMENRKVLRIPNQAPSAPPAPDMQDPSMGMGQTMEPMGGPDDAGMDPNMGSDPSAMGGEPDAGMENQFDTNFDAGVEADEETDPKHYIQQLTGKLSQSLNSFNSEQGPDAGLSKYVASMIISAACKNLDEKAKKELIEKINNASSDDEEMPDDDGGMDGGDMGEEQPMGGEEQPMDDGQQPMMERILTKKELQELAFGVQDRQDNQQPQKAETKSKSIFNGKKF